MSTILLLGLSDGAAAELEQRLQPSIQAIA